MLDLKKINLYLAFALVLSSCTSLSPLVLTPPSAKLMSPPADVMQVQKANFREMLLNFFTVKQAEQTK